ncbi:restriction endonuclease [Spirillospora sp. NPDC052269]
MGDHELVVPFGKLSEADLVLDAIYEGGSSGNINDEPLARLLPGVGNQGGFRLHGSARKGAVRFAVLYSTGNEPDWPDELDPKLGLFTYYGDNRKPGQELHGTGRGGNVLLRDVFGWTHDPAERAKVPPFFLFEKAAPTGRNVRFRGLLAPGGPSLTPDDELQAIWRSTRGQRFQNYRSRFTVLDVPKVARSWIRELARGEALGSSCPAPWREWIDSRSYLPLLAPSTTTVRSKTEQLPDDPVGKQIIEAVYRHFADPHGFEACAVEIWRMLAPATGKCEVTRQSRDGGRDAVGEYLLGPTADQVPVEFALEAKCYNPGGRGVGVKEVARLISRIRHRQFGVLVTTSYFHEQVYKEVREDGHPIALICARDVVDALRSHGYGTRAAVQSWLEHRFPAAD